MKRALSIFLTLLVFVTPLARAGIMADLNQMFMSNSTAPTTLSTRDRTGVFGGSIAVRLPIKSVNLVSFDPPRLNAGCGGIDLYGGSFSFINAQALVALFRNIASNAAGLAFKAAIKLISPSLDRLMTEFQSLLQAMNNLGKNSCSMAHLIVDKASSAISDAIDGDGNVGATKRSMFSDAADALSGYMADATSYFNSVGRVTPRAGNQVTKAIIASGSGGILGMAGLPNSDGSVDDASNPNSLNNRILMSFTGYSIAGVPCEGLNEDGIPTQTTSTAGAIGTKIECKAPAILTLDDMIRGGGTGSPRPDLPLRMYECVNPNGSGNSSDADTQPCTTMRVSIYNYQGIEGWVNNMLFGANDGSIVSSSIVGMMNGGVSSKFSASQIQFLHQAGLPVLGLMSKTSDPNVRINIANMLKRPIINCVAAAMGVALYKAANGIQTNNTYQLDDTVIKNIDNLRHDYLDKQRECLSDRSHLTVVQMLNLTATLNSKAAQ
ncbi:conjugal transfer protein TraH [Herbaspirillum sp.]|uniref:conjugal transfer protein TraH n=1 Tax=Herbaspirillum sp. TaxID=1890675 RepID=UPI000C0B0EDE|nr:conjugal transfer protein TraH [Herbaspirillum sp.]MAF04688.1 conjugal transfer protein TraH [Herbaspirillum sp.]|tara:strand:+ start:6244 stop:7722 length:1479 start_codon:yes stop_codon:yes gene_type:complete